MQVWRPFGGSVLSGIFDEEQAAMHLGHIVADHAAERQRDVRRIAIFQVQAACSATSMVMPAAAGAAERIWLQYSASVWAV